VLKFRIETSGLFDGLRYLPALAAFERWMAPEPLELNTNWNVEAKKAPFADEAIYAMPVAGRSAGRLVMITVTLAVSEQQAMEQPLERVPTGGAFFDLLREGW
jgi:hypothetical protein